VTPERSLMGSGRGWPISFGIVAGVALVIVLTSYPLVPVSISGDVTTVGPGTCVYCPNFHPAQTEWIPSGPSVKVTWTESAGETVVFQIANSTGASVCSWSASQGACTFMSSGGNYTLWITAASSPPGEYGASFTIEWYVPLL
jgi:hypothetical protein